jgi:prostaglandin-E synthase 1
MTALQLYVIFTALLVINLLGLWVYSGTVRGQTKTTLNEEDARSILRGAKLTEAEPPEIQRALRAHANAMANIIPFLFLAQLWVSITLPKPVIVLAVCGAFTVARYGHSFAYLKGKQPWRTVFFAIGVLATLAVLVLLGIGTFA